jgi:hypothetical protein
MTNKHETGDGSAVLGRKVDAYYPVSKHFCWRGTVTAVEGRRVRVKCDDFDNLEDWFGVENVREVMRPNEKLTDRRENNP